MTERFNRVMVGFGVALMAALLIPAVGSAREPGEVVVAADFDGDGKVDRAIRGPGMAMWELRYANGSVGMGFADGRRDCDSRLNADAHAGDLDGDRRMDLVWRRQGMDHFIVGLATGRSLVLRDLRLDYRPGRLSQVVLVGDFDGDGRDELAWRRSGWSFVLFVGLGRGQRAILPGTRVWAAADHQERFQPTSAQVVVRDGRDVFYWVKRSGEQVFLTSDGAWWTEAPARS